MLQHPRTALTAAVAAAAALPVAADATTYTATLTGLLTYSSGGTAGVPGNISSSTATFSYNDVSNLVSQTGGLYNVRFTITPTTTLFRTSITGLVVGNGGAASASTFTCSEGNFGGNVGASICGNYTFGANLANESTATWGPGTAVSRVIGGDDAASGPQQSIAAYNGFNTLSFTGTQLVLSNATCNPAGATVCTNPAARTAGLQLTFTTVVAPAIPLPAAAWLFGGALAGLAGLRRRA